MAAHAQRGRYPLFIYLVDKGADVISQCNDGLCIVSQVACMFLIVGFVDETKAMIRYLLDKGADINAPDSGGRTPLALLKRYGFPDPDRFPDSDLSFQFLQKLGTKIQNGFGYMLFSWFFLAYLAVRTLIICW
jgi:hypothetical protein